MARQPRPLFSGPIVTRVSSTIYTRHLRVESYSIYKIQAKLRAKEVFFFLSLSLRLSWYHRVRQPGNMGSLEALAAQIQGLSSSAGDISRLHVILKQAEDSLRSESTRLSPILNQLDPSIHSLGYLYIL
jgi:hypothetical protein